MVASKGRMSFSCLRTGTYSFGVNRLAAKGFRSIRNYMSKPWFIKGTTQTINSPLSKVIKNALGGSDPNLERETKGN